MQMDVATPKGLRKSLQQPTTGAMIRAKSKNVGILEMTAGRDLRATVAEATRTTAV